MDLQTLHQRLESAREQIAAGEQVDAEGVARLLQAHLQAAVEAASREDVQRLLETVRALTAETEIAAAAVKDEMDKVQEGRRGNEGYRSLRAHRKTQRLYRRA